MPNPFKGFNSTTATKTSTITDLNNLYIIDGGESNHDVPNQPLLEPTRNVSVLIIRDNSSDDDDGFPDGISLVLAYEATQTGRLARRIPTTPTAGDFSTSQTQSSKCEEADAVTVIIISPRF